MALIEFAENKIAMKKKIIEKEFTHKPIKTLSRNKPQAYVLFKGTTAMSVKLFIRYIEKKKKNKNKRNKDIRK